MSRADLRDALSDLLLTCCICARKDTPVVRTSRGPAAVCRGCWEVVEKGPYPMSAGERIVVGPEVGGSTPSARRETGDHAAPSSASGDLPALTEDDERELARERQAEAEATYRSDQRSWEDRG